MRGTAELSCGHWIVYLDSDDPPPEHGPWSLWPITMEIVQGMSVGCLVCLSMHQIATWLPGQWLTLTDRGTPTIGS